MNEIERVARAFAEGLNEVYSEQYHGAAVERGVAEIIKIVTEERDAMHAIFYGPESLEREAAKRAIVNANGMIDRLRSLLKEQG